MFSSFFSPITPILDGSENELRFYKGAVATRALLAKAALDHGKSPLLLVRSAQEMAQVKGALQLFDQPAGTACWDNQWVFFPSSIVGKRARGAVDLWAERLACLFSLIWSRGPKGVVLTPEDLLIRWPHRDFFNTNNLALQTGEEISSEMILEQAAGWGYTRSMLVSRPGEMAQRGDILDIFCPGYHLPLRFEFFGDNIEDIRLFDPISQRSHSDLHEAVLLPVTPTPGTPENINAAERRWKWLVRDKILKDKQKQALLLQLEQGESPLPPGVLYENATTLEQWFPEHPVFFLPSSGGLDATQIVDELFFEENLPESIRESDLSRRLLMREQDSLCNTVESSQRVIFDDLVMGVEKSGVDLPEFALHSFDDVLFRFGDLDDARNDRPWHTLLELIATWRKDKKQTILSFHTERGRKKFLKLAQMDGVSLRTEYAPDVSGVFAVVSPFQQGADLGWCDALFLSEDVLQPKGSVKPPPSKSFKGLTSYDGISPGDLLVHRDYGLGSFGGLVRLEFDESGNDYLLLEYSGADKLYLPVDRLALVQPYKGPESVLPRLDKLGGVGWVRTREKAKKAIEKIAHDLVEMYAYRRIAKGYAYSPLGELYREFEASFGFEETPDQGKAIQEVLEEMERPEPMDRLVCGDVGFGKTEVAMRAAFRAALDGRQVALLCPTTVLAEQHYQNFRSRFQGFPLNIGLLSRFVPPKKQKDVLEAAKRGGIDILIGTHRLLSKDVELPSLGLLILDEEQRFGVKHKERLKKLKKNIDALTLTATPIPRTLQLSLSGIRSLSVIETAPQERKPVETALIERDDAMLRAVLERELEREGQVFWVHNRVRGLNRVMDYVKGLIPNARVGQAHGQMPEHQLEETMHKFWHGELDVLVCTAIVESGLDFPRANTLIVDQAQMFGLGQLYQLRGRVGRSDKQAYAYFLVSGVDSLAEKSRKRMKIILEMDYLGAGFQVAMEDLRLRGAGNILGEAQSGQIAKVGLDLFLEMLEEEVRKLKGDPLQEHTEPELSIGFEAHIPEPYISDSRERLKYYKHLTSAAERTERLEILAEIQDRFGKAPEALQVFLDVLDLKHALSALQVVKADLHTSTLRLVWGEDTSVVQPAQLVEWVAKRTDFARLKPPSILELRMDPDTPLRKNLEFAAQELASLLNLCKQQAH